jgi:hypothetical protein
MKTQPWLVCALSAAVVGSISSISRGQDAAPPAKPAAAVEEEGPFAPKGKTGKLREEAPAPAEEKEIVETSKPGRGGVDLVAGFGKTGSASSNSSVTAFSFMLGASYKLKPEISLGVRLPITTGSVTPPAPAEKFSSTAVGNLELALAYENDMGPHTKLPITFALAVPTAGGDPFATPSDTASMRHYAVNQAAAAGRGFEDNELFEGHRFGVIPGAKLDYGRKAIHTGAFTKIPVLIKAGGEQPDPATPANLKYTLNGVGVQWVTGGQFFYNIVEGKVDLGARAWITYFIKDVYDVPAATEGPAKLNFVVEPQVLAKFNAIRAGLGFILPIGGRAGGDVQMNGLRLAAAYVF